MPKVPHDRALGGLVESVQALIKLTKWILVGVALILQQLLFSASAAGQSSSVCRRLPIVTDSRDDDRHAREFCRRAIPEGLATSLMAKESILWVNVSASARTMMLDRLRTEALVKRWMDHWKQITNRNVVTVNVMWSNVEIAVGETTLFGGDQVTVRQP